MFGSIVLFHHIGYSLARENVKRMLEDDNIITAIQMLENLIIEHDLYKNNDVSNDEIANLDNLMLHHAIDHIQYVEEETQKQATIRALSDN